VEAFRRRIHDVVEGGRSGASRFFDISTIILILLSVLMVVLDTAPELSGEHKPFFFIVELLAVTLFTIEYLLRVWTCVDDARGRYNHPIEGRLRYMLTPLALIDLMAILVFFFTFFDRFTFLRVLRLLKLLRYAAALDMLISAIRSERRALSGAAILMAVLLVTMSSLAYLAERDVQPERFNSIPAAMWWCIVTLTTVGYGDVVPVSVLGKMVAGMTTVLGLCMFALPAGILASAFAQEAKKRDFMITWSMVSRVPFFGRLTAGNIADIVSLLKPRVAVPGERIVRKGDPAEAMFFIISGEMEVDLPPKPIILKSGDFFGEIALLTKADRTATVTASASSQLLYLESDDFRRLLESHPDLKATLDETANRRLAELRGLE
jgi:voltage-gated potassium channel